MNRLLVVHIAFLMTAPFYAILTLLLASADTAAAAQSIPGIVPWLLVIVSGMNIPLGFFLPMVAANQPPMTRLILGDAIFESIGIFGLVGSFIGMPLWISLTLIGVSFLLMAFNFTRIL